MDVVTGGAASSAVLWESKVAFEKGVRVMLEPIDGWRSAPVWTGSIVQATEDWFKYLGVDKKAA